MSRVGKQELTIPSGVTVTNDAGTVTITGPRGTLTRSFRSDITIVVDGEMVRFEKAVENNFTKALWGTYASHVKNMIAGVTEGFKKVLILDGVGYRLELSGTTLKMALGFSHPVVVEVPEGIKATVEKNTLTVEGIDKEAVGSFAAKIYSLKKPEPYKGKGFHYEGQQLIRKQGKKQGTAA